MSFLKSEVIIYDDYMSKLTETKFKCKTFYIYESNYDKQYPHIMKIVRLLGRVSIHMFITIPGIRTIECKEVYDYRKYRDNGYVFNSFNCKAINNNEVYNFSIKFTSENYLMHTEKKSLYGEIKMNDKVIQVFFEEKKDEESFNFINSDRVAFNPV